jgi:transketolase
VPSFEPGSGPIATRAAGGKVMEALAPALPELVGGSADLHPSTKTYLDAYAAVSEGAYAGRNLHFGVREHAMAGILNGMALHGGFRVYGSTFLVFSDYMRPSIRLAAIMGVPVIYVFTHDSIFVGEDGPTHQPVEQAASLRAIPHLIVLRPADAREVAGAWKFMVKYGDGPASLLLSRQKLPVLAQTDPDRVARGAYVLLDADDPELLLLATGSEVALAAQAHAKLTAEGVRARVVSMPSWELFEAQPQAYRDKVLPPSVTARLAIEAGVGLGWARYVGDRGAILSQDRFGASAPYKVLAEKFGFTVDDVMSKAKALLK